MRGVGSGWLGLRLSLRSTSLFPPLAEQGWAQAIAPTDTVPQCLSCPGVLPPPPPPRQKKVQAGEARQRQQLNWDPLSCAWETGEGDEARRKLWDLAGNNSWLKSRVPQPSPGSLLSALTGARVYGVSSTVLTIIAARRGKESKQTDQQIGETWAVLLCSNNLSRGAGSCGGCTEQGTLAVCGEPGLSPLLARCIKGAARASSASLRQSQISPAPPPAAATSLFTPCRGSGVATSHESRGGVLVDPLPRRPRCKPACPPEGLRRPSAPAKVNFVCVISPQTPSCSRLPAGVFLALSPLFAAAVWLCMTRCQRPPDFPERVGRCALPDSAGRPGSRPSPPLQQLTQTGGLSSKLLATVAVPSITPPIPCKQEQPTDFFSPLAASLPGLGLQDGKRGPYICLSDWGRFSRWRHSPLFSAPCTQCPRVTAARVCTAITRVRERVVRVPGSGTAGRSARAGLVLLQSPAFRNAYIIQWLGEGEGSGRSDRIPALLRFLVWERKQGL
ncbi:uncharacterized protein LOC135227953 [Loxodonta africana]|uniref:uncharacterized protein LOC135227953 n=1 Tax=Loxodonta africana TaxID=9785 RepID=UPI0030D0EBF9